MPFAEDQDMIQAVAPKSGRSTRIIRPLNSWDSNCADSQNDRLWNGGQGRLA
jgi:hypothetical protein